MGLLNPGGPIAQFKRNRCSISPVEVILLSGVRSFSCFRILHNEIFIRFIRFLKFSRNLHNILNFCLNLGKNIIHIYGLYKLPSKFL